MPRIVGVDVPAKKKTYIALTYIYGIGQTTAKQICAKTAIDPDKRAHTLSDDEVMKLSKLIEDQYTVEGALRRAVAQNITRLRTIRCYRGIRHQIGLPVRGQQTQSNARTRKGPRKTIAGKKIAGKK
ncbi:MAG: 30S ribosomal protein S13 [Planctomycetes bacterium]|nr:30S ribosomal protein S13 [Planctomycetota bacterium]